MSQTQFQTLPQYVMEQDALGGSAADYLRLRGSNLLARTEDYFRWSDARRQSGFWPYSNAIEATPDREMRVANDAGVAVSGLNFASQDYLSLSSHPKIRAAVQEALNVYGPHSAGSPMLQGNTKVSLELEGLIADTLQMKHVVLFPTGWAAGYGSIRALVRRNDHVITDALAHNCLSEGMMFATRNIHRVRHLDMDAVADKLRQIRRQDYTNGILVVTEGLFSMDADSPDIVYLQELCDLHDATLLVDIAHDFGSLGPGGTGAIGIQKMLGNVDLVMGSFSKTFASNGGFLATDSRAVKEYVKAYSASHIFSNALSPLQANVVKTALEIVRSAEGDQLRAQLLDAIQHLRTSLAQYGIDCFGNPSPIVPVPLGDEARGPERRRGGL
ncbi:MAG: aminotransferase class I/II-fold pyridoxal phosphate-dependent enzyme [Caldilineaceae bacterium]